MTIVQSYDELLEKPSGLILLKAVPLLDILKHVAPRSKLHCNSQKFIGEKDFFELYNVRVQKSVVVEQLSLYILGDLHINQSSAPSTHDHESSRRSV